MSPRLSVRSYQAALRAHVTHSGEQRTLLSAYELGRQLMNEGAGLLDIVRLHAQSVQALTTAGVASTETLRHSDDFLAEILTPFEKAYVGWRDANIALQHLSASLEHEATERTHELHDGLSRLQAAESEKRRLLERAVAAEEQERQRLADELHDDTIQAMTTVALRLAGLRGHGEHADAELIDRLERSVTDAIERLRTLVLERIPPVLDRDGLAATIHTYVRMLMDVGPEVVLDDHLRDEPPRHVAQAVVRVTQEALTNVRKHASARHVRITLEPDGEGVKAVIADDGQGFDLRALDRPRPGHVGTLSMRERASLAGGWCTIESSAGAGTTVTLWVPLRGDTPFSGPYGRPDGP